MQRSRVGKTGDFLKKIGDSNRTFHIRMGTIKDRNCKDLTEAKEINKGGNNTQRNYIKKGLKDQDNHDGVTTYLEPDILECEVKWALGSITTNKASVGGGILAELYKILKDDAVKVLHSVKERESCCVSNSL